MKLNAIAYSLFATVVLAGSASAATVDGGKVHFVGKIIEAACAVSTDSADQTVNLGQYRTAAFTKVGDVTTKIPFNVVLNDCDTTVATEASVSFTGQIDDVDTTLLAVDASGNNTTIAGGVGIEILDNYSKTLTPNGQVFSTAQKLNDGTNTIPFAARYKSSIAAVTAGQANATATFTMKYE